MRPRPLAPAARDARRLGLYGGSFDPPHAGHLHVAREARRAFGLEHVVFVPAARPPHKPGRALASAGDRVAMLELLLADEPGTSVWTVELEREGPSYTLDTVEALLAARAAAGREGGVHLLLGSDNLPGLPRWHGAARLLALVQPVVVLRDGAPLDEEPLAALSEDARARVRAGFVAREPCAASASDLRRRLSSGAEPGDALPARVRAYARAHGLYRAP